MTDTDVQTMLEEAVTSLSHIERLLNQLLSREARLRATLQEQRRFLRQLERRYGPRPICGEWMPNAGEPCARRPGHGFEHRTRYALENQRIEKHARRVA